MSYSLNSSKGVISGIIWGTTIDHIKGEFRQWLIYVYIYINTYIYIYMGAWGIKGRFYFFGSFSLAHITLGRKKDPFTKNIRNPINQKV